jgi:hypothetical protein
MIKRIGIALLVVALGLVGVLKLIGSSDSVAVRFDYKNAHGVAVYDSSKTVGDGNNVLVTKISTSGESKNLDKDHSYFVTYEGNSGYAGGRADLNTKDSDSNVSIDPAYSRAHLDSMLQGELPDITQAYQDLYGEVTAYHLQSGRLYHDGDWYGATLTYSGDDNFNNDTLRIVFHKEDGIWKVKTVPPDITLSKFIYPDIPVDILRDVNNSL